VLEWCWSSLEHIGVCWKLELNGGCWSGLEWCWSGLEWFGMAWSSVGVRVGSTHAPLFVPICIYLLLTLYLYHQIYATMAYLSV